jgi:WD40 repeat protein
MAFSRDGEYLAAGTDNGYVSIWNARSGAWIGEAQAAGNFVSTVSFTASGDLVAAPNEIAGPGTLITWDATRNWLAREFRVSIISPGIVASAENGPLVYTVTSRHTGEIREGVEGGALATHITEWDTESAEKTRSLKPAFSPLSDTQSLAVTDDGKTLAGATYDAIWVWDLSTDRVDHAFETGEEITFVDISPNGRQIFTIDFLSGRLRVWDASSGQELEVSLPNKTPALTNLEGLAVTPDGERLVTSGPEVRIWTLVFS